MNAFFHLTGLDNGGGRWYLWWSGVGSDLGYLGLFAIVWHHVNCHVRRCWRPARHPVEGTPYKVCRRHHPTIPDRAPHASDIHAAHLAGLK